MTTYYGCTCYGCTYYDYLLWLLAMPTYLLWRGLQARLAFAVRRKGKGGGQEEAAALRAQIKPLETKQAWGGR